MGGTVHFPAVTCYTSAYRRLTLSGSFAGGDVREQRIGGKRNEEDGWPGIAFADAGSVGVLGGCRGDGDGA